MTYAFFEENGSFKAGRILQDQTTSLQIEHPSGKRSKVKSAQAVLRFANPAPEQLLQQAQALADDMDSQFVWECAPQGDVNALALAQDYFGANPSPAQQAAMVLKLHSDPVYFHRRGGAMYRPAPPDILQAALAAVAKRQAQTALQADYVRQMVEARELPPPIAARAAELLWQPDKQSLEWKALEAAGKAAALSPERLLIELGAFSDAYALHLGRFLHEHFPKGRAVPQIAQATAITVRELPLAKVQAFSLDDISTTEIDDALSFESLADGNWRIGVHIAAPALGFAPGDALDAIARARLSTVYLPGDKIPMQPDTVITRFSLDAGERRPALSLYITVDPRNDYAVVAEHSQLETIVVQENLRHNLIGAQVNAALATDTEQNFPHAQVLRPLWLVAQALSARRDLVRGKPEGQNRAEYQFTVHGDLDDAARARIEITPRERAAPLDRLVAEYMILANQTWGALLKNHHLPGIYRSQQAGKPRMSTHPLPHESIGVAQYAWCTSPLRRYVDLVNQWQIIAALDHGISAPLVAPFKPRDADLFAIIAAFEAKYTAYQAFQSQMERYWCLRWLSQEGVFELDAEVLKEGLVRCSRLPLILRVSGLLPPLRGARVRIGIESIDEIAIDAQGKVLDKPENAALPDWAGPASDAASVEWAPPPAPVPPNSA